MEENNNKERRVVKYILLSTGHVFEGRKLAKAVLGAGRFRRLLRDGKLIFE